VDDTGSGTCLMTGEIIQPAIYFSCLQQNETKNIKSCSPGGITIVSYSVSPVFISRPVDPLSKYARCFTAKPQVHKTTVSKMGQPPLPSIIILPVDTTQS
jgi:hypothetical protein